MQNVQSSGANRRRLPKQQLVGDGGEIPTILLWGLLPVLLDPQISNAQVSGKPSRLVSYFRNGWDCLFTVVLLWTEPCISETITSGGYRQQAVSHLLRSCWGSQRQATGSLLSMGGKDLVPRHKTLCVGGNLVSISLGKPARQYCITCKSRLTWTLEISNFDLL